MFFHMVYKSGKSFYRFVTIHACDRRMDRIRIARPRLHSMQRGKNSRNIHLPVLVKTDPSCGAVSLR